MRSRLFLLAGAARQLRPLRCLHRGGRAVRNHDGGDAPFLRCAVGRCCHGGSSRLGLGTAPTTRMALVTSKRCDVSQGATGTNALGDRFCLQVHAPARTKVHIVGEAAARQGRPWWSCKSVALLPKVAFNYRPENSHAQACYLQEQGTVQGWIHGTRNLCRFASW